MKKIIKAFFRMLLNQRGRSNLRRGGKKTNPQKSDSVHYFEAKHFFNDLDNQEDYYLKITPGKEHEFIRKDEIDDN